MPISRWMNYLAKLISSTCLIILSKFLSNKVYITVNEYVQIKTFILVYIQQFDYLDLNWCIRSLTKVLKWCHIWELSAPILIKWVCDQYFCYSLVMVWWQTKQTIAVNKNCVVECWFSLHKRRFRKIIDPSFVI